MRHSAIVSIIALGLTSFSAAAPLSGLAESLAELFRREDVDDSPVEGLGKDLLSFGSGGSGGSKRGIESSASGQLSGAVGPVDEGSQ
ncbi:hypothetical protein BDV33DRAFT_197426 [Aspergillus novoparasiticus]|uniref:Uncharacterized protein n=1 Tax=Aspergillus novoparasiticus TaxID=986946 RepID=A0A5N6F9U3_9EURO|nr:hypothetical protein BDV33DRAFT_197426 [Aspergillus novoparasiticus]